MSSASSLCSWFGEVALDLLFPPKCVGCGDVGSFICPSCEAALPRVRPPVCPLCGKPQPQAALCPGCWGWRPAINGIRSPFTFDGSIRRAIHDLKYHNLRALSATLAGQLARHLSENPMPAEVLVPVPLHPARLRERGYNHSALLAKDLGATSGIPVDEGTLVRKKNSEPQAKTNSVEQRRENVAQAFAVRDRALKGKKVLLIDDVCTSGATLNSCAAALIKGGASSVWGLTLAKET